MRKLYVLLASFFVLFFPQIALAHEAYVLTNQQFEKGLLVNSPNPFAPLFDSQYFIATIFITIFVVALYTLVNIWATTSLAAKFDSVIKKANVIGPLIIRIAISASFFYAAEANSFLGPEISLSTIAGGSIIRFILFAIALMVFFGVFVEVAATIGLILFIYLITYFNIYMVTYVNYLGELIVLLLFGSRMLSFDKYFFGNKLWFKGLEKYKEYEVPIVRILYGVALMFAGFSIKFMHQGLTIAVYNEYHLKDFFHASASFIAAGAGLSEILIGFFILIGFAQRLTVVISLIFITLSLLYFNEMLWPHLMLYGISFSLIINSADKLSVERYLIPLARTWRKKIFRV